jgi:hypothetical protein
VGTSPVAFFSLPLLGVHPTLESLGMQLVAAAIVAAGMLAQGHRAAPRADAKS